MRVELAGLRRWCEETGGAPQRGLLAQLIGVAVLRDLLCVSVLQSQLHGPREFHQAWLPGLPSLGASPLSFGLARVGTIVLTAAALALVAQRGVRRAAAILLLGYGYAFLNDAPGYTNNAVLLLLLLGVVAVAPLEDSAGIWPLRLGQLTTLALYAGGICAKLSDYWLSGTLLNEILHRYSGEYARLFGWEHPAVFRIGAMAALVTEAAIAGGLWFSRTRMAAMALGAAFHLSTEVMLPVRMFTLLVLGSYALFLDEQRARSWLACTTRNGRSPLKQVALCGLLWLSTLTHYPTRPLVAFELGLVIAVSALLARARRAVVPPTAAAPGAHSRRWASVVVSGFALLQLFALVKPALGLSKHFAWRMFSESLVLRVHPEVFLDGHWRRATFPNTQWRWRADGFRYHWTSLSEERSYLQAYADWLAASFPDARPLRVVASYRLNGAPVATAMFQAR